MRLSALAVVLALVAGCVAPPPPASPSTPVDEELPDPPTPAVTSLARQAQEVTVRIRALGCEQLGIGSGFVLPGGVVVTNRHVVGEPREITINTWDGRRFDADVTGIALDSDLAILRLDDDVDLPVAELRTTPVERGEPVVVVGYPEGGPATVTTGRVVGLVSGELLGEPADVIRIDAEIRPGNSGGPVLDEQGRVIGIVFALEPGTGTGLAVPVETLLARLDAAALSRPAGC
jgi:S1-C subfamily serine protease